jgi:transcription-repair coupling factor (superfamily II helicase)
MEIYHRLGEAPGKEEVDGILSEIEDRFGPVPPPVLWLCVLTKIRLYAASIGISFIKLEKLTMSFEITRGKVTQKKTVALPQKKKPHEFERAVIDLLSS